MKILYDDQIFAMQRHGGISRYFAELLNVFSHTMGISYDLTTQFTQNTYARKYNLINRRLSLRIENFLLTLVELFTPTTSDAVAVKDRINSEYRDKLFREANYDVFHPTYYNPYFLSMIYEKPFVITVHDMIHELFPQMYPIDDINSQMTTHWKMSLLSRADKIIAVSENTKRDILSLTGIPEEKITVVYHASSIRPNMGVACDINLPDYYILFVGERIRYKNFVPFVRAIAELLRKNRNLYLVCAGGRDLTDPEKQLFTELSIYGQVLQFTVDDETLAYLYSKAIMFAFPSLYEGFGMPILEAFSCGCPVILSEASSFPEVAGEAALYFNPTDIESIKYAVERVLYDSELRERLVNAGLQRVVNFSWDKTASETMAVYKTLL